MIAHGRGRTLATSLAAVRGFGEARRNLELRRVRRSEHANIAPLHEPTKRGRGRSARWRRARRRNSRRPPPGGRQSGDLGITPLIAKYVA
jgi:hypothetical protein